MNPKMYEYMILQWAVNFNGVQESVNKLAAEGWEPTLSLSANANAAVLSGILLRRVKGVS